jgi:uncharacterized membrane protein YgcG
MRQVPNWPGRLAPGAAAIFLLTGCALRAEVDEVIPPAPADHFHDDAGVVSSDVSARLNETLAQFERETSNRLGIVVSRKMQSASYVGEYAHRIFDAWNPGPNCAVLFVFLEDRKTFIVAGAGLQSAFRDDTSIDISSRVLGSPMQSQRYDEAFSLGADALMRAVRVQDSITRPRWPLLLVFSFGVLAFWRTKRAA